jgi:CDP-glucose 4,6-dehydratase
MIQQFWKTYKGKNVLITGHTGFKGSWLSIWLQKLGANVIGYSLAPYTKKDNFVLARLENKITHIIGDVRDYNSLLKVFYEFKPEFVFHLAAQPIVKESYYAPKNTYDINIGGTVNVFECCRLSDSVKVILNITSDKCYENNESLWGYREIDPMGGYDPYSSSKGCSELITSAYRNSFFNPEQYKNHGKSISSVRAGNVIGGGDWQTDRLIPDCIKAIETDKTIIIRNPYSIRPWQYVLDPLCGYILLAVKMYNQPEIYSGAWNFGPGDAQMVDVKKLVTKLIAGFGKGSWDVQNRSESYHETKLLSLDITKAKNLLGWSSVYNVDDTIRSTIEWYKNYKDSDVYQICTDQIVEYEKLLNKE